MTDPVLLEVIDDLEAAHYTAAKRSAAHNPHEYSVRREWSDDARFVQAVETLRHHGVDVSWGRRTFRQFYANGWFYWTMGDPMETTWIINRKPYWREPLPPQVYDTATAELYDTTYDTAEHRTENRVVHDRLANVVAGFDRILDVGCGTGLMLDLDVIPDAAVYYGIDGSPPMLEVARLKHPDRRFLCCRAEDFYRPLGGGDLVVALFGTASYVHPSAFERFRAQGAKLWLMYYRPGYVELHGDPTVRSTPIQPEGEMERMFGKYDLAAML